MNLNEILEAVAKGKMNIHKAKSLIERSYAGTHEKRMNQTEEGHEPQEDHAKDGLRNAFEKIKKSVNIDEILRKSSHLVNQLSENMPHQIDKLQENISNTLQPFGFSPNATGIESKLS